jgi:uncharacterized protein YbjT (DUF2867 family)
MGAPRSVLLLGATGLVGSECLRLLSNDDAFDRVVVLSRRALDEKALTAKVEAHIVNFDHLTAAARFFAVDQIICALGTTMKEARSRQRFRAVDLLYPLTAAHLGIERKVSHFLLVSAHGANAKSLFFYSRIKGELEAGVSALPYRSLTIARPSVLVGTRENPRMAERIAAAGLSFLAPASVRPIRASEVASALVRQAVLDEPGRRVLDAAELRRLAREQLGRGVVTKSPAKVHEEIPQSSVA